MSRPTQLVIVLALLALALPAALPLLRWVFRF